MPGEMTYASADGNSLNRDFLTLPVHTCQAKWQIGQQNN